MGVVGPVPGNATRGKVVRSLGVNVGGSYVSQIITVSNYGITVWCGSAPAGGTPVSGRGCFLQTVGPLKFLCLVLDRSSTRPATPGVVVAVDGVRAWKLLEHTRDGISAPVTLGVGAPPVINMPIFTGYSYKPSLQVT